MVVCLQEGADLHMAQLMPLPLTVSCFSKIQIGFTFLVPAHSGSLGQRAIINGCMCISGDLTTLQVNRTKKSPASFVMLCKQEEKYSLESTDPRESEIRVHLRP